jgi:DNA-binding NtrC family response regulator
MLDQRADILLVEDDSNGVKLRLRAFRTANLANTVYVAGDGAGLEQSKPPVVTHAAFAAQAVTRALVGRTVADVERDLILETLKHCLGNRTHAANILGIAIRTLRNKLNEYATDGLSIPPPAGGDVRMAV